MDEYPESGGNNNHRDKDNPIRPSGSDYSPQDGRPATTVTEGTYTTRKTNRGPITTTTTLAPRNPYEQGNGNRPNTVTLQASSTDPNSDINGVINGLLQNQNSNNKTVIITVIDNQNNRPNGGTGSGGRPATADGGSATRPNVNNRPSGQQTGQKPNNNNNNNNQQVSGGGSSGSYTGLVTKSRLWN